MAFPSMSNIKIDTGNSGKLIVLGGLIVGGVLVLLVGLISFFSGYGYYNSQTAKLNALISSSSSGTSKFTYVTTSQPALSMAKQMSKFLWTKNDVYSFAETLNVYKGSTLTIGQEVSNTFTYPDGTSAQLKTMTINFGCVMDLNSFLELYSKIEADPRITTIRPVSVDALKSLKEISIVFYLAPSVLPDKAYPLTTSNVYILDYATPEGGVGAVPVFFGSRILYGVFKKYNPEPTNPPNLPPNMISIVSPVVEK